MLALIRARGLPAWLSFPLHLGGGAGPGLEVLPRAIGPPVRPPARLRAGALAHIAICWGIEARGEGWGSKPPFAVLGHMGDGEANQVLVV